MHRPSRSAPVDITHGPGRPVILALMTERRAVTVGRRRAELVGVPGDVPIAVWPTRSGWSRPLPVTSAGWGETSDPDDPVLLSVGFPLIVELEVGPAG